MQERVNKIEEALQANPELRTVASDDLALLRQFTIVVPEEPSEQQAEEVEEQQLLSFQKNVNEQLIDKSRLASSEGL